MQNATEITRLASPGEKPQGLAFLASTLYVGAWETNTVYGIDPKTGEVRSSDPAPGTPYGLAAFGDSLRAVVALEDDDRYLVSFVPGKGFDIATKVALPEQSGSHLASDGTHFYVVQMGARRIVELDADGNLLRSVPVAERLGGIAVANGTLYGIAGDAELEHLHLATIDLSGETPVVTDVASIDDLSRGLTYDGSNFWTSHRDEHRIVAFTP